MLNKVRDAIEIKRPTLVCNAFKQREQLDMIYTLCDMQEKRGYIILFVLKIEKNFNLKAGKNYSTYILSADKKPFSKEMALILDKQEKFNKIAFTFKNDLETQSFIDTINKKISNILNIENKNVFKVAPVDVMIKIMKEFNVY